MAQRELSVDNLMAEALRRREELNVFIRLLMNKMQGRDLVEDFGRQANGPSCSGDTT
jgi:hypothetical protein